MGGTHTRQCMTNNRNRLAANLTVCCQHTGKREGQGLLHLSSQQQAKHVIIRTWDDKLILLNKDRTILLSHILVHQQF